MEAHAAEGVAPATRVCELGVITVPTITIGSEAILDKGAAR